MDPNGTTFAFEATVFQQIWGFHSHGGTPIAEWFKRKIPLTWDDLGVPLFQETSISAHHKHIEIPELALLWEGLSLCRRQAVDREVTVTQLLSQIRMWSEMPVAEGLMA